MNKNPEVSLYDQYRETEKRKRKMEINLKDKRVVNREREQLI